MLETFLLFDMPNKIEDGRLFCQCQSDINHKLFSVEILISKQTKELIHSHG